MTKGARSDKDVSPRTPDAGSPVPDPEVPDAEVPDPDVPDGGSPRQQARAAKRRAKDLAYEERMARKHSGDVQFHNGHHIVDTTDLSEAFPEPETPEYDAGTVRRRITHGVILVLLLALVAAAVVLAGMLQRGELELRTGFSRPTPTAASCPTDTLEYPANATVNVHVYNAGGQEGLAGTVGAELMARGHHVLSVSNGETEVDAPVVIVAGEAGRAEAFNLQRNLVGSDFVQDDRPDSNVDVILTGGFGGLVPVDQVDQAPGMLSCPRLNPTAAPAEPAAEPVPAPAAAPAPAAEPAPAAPAP